MAEQVLILGYGNPGRQDDGLGPAAAAAIERLQLPHVRVESNYLLAIENAADAAEVDLVIFVDAAESGPEPFEVRELNASDEIAFTSHIVKPEVVLGICHKCYGCSPRALLVAIRGYEFELEEMLTERARQNLEEALTCLRWILGVDSRPSDFQRQTAEQPT
jgi:hydrogenase maturation protease